MRKLRKQLWLTALCLIGLMAMMVSCASENAGGDEKILIEYIAYQTEKDGKWGLIGLDGQVLVAPKWDETPTDAAQGRFFAKEDSLYSLYTTDPTPQRVGDEKYKSAGIFCNGLCPVVKPGMWPQYIDRDGNVVIDCKEYGGIGVENAGSFNEGLAKVELKNGKLGFIDTSGKLVIPAKYGYVRTFQNGYCIVRYDKLSLDSDVDDGYTWYVIDKKGNELFAAKSTTMDYDGDYQKNGLIMATYKDGKEKKKVLVNAKGEKVLALECDDAGELKGDLFVFERNGMWGVMNIKGEVVVPAKYESLELEGARIIEAKYADDDDSDDYTHIIMSMKGEVYNTIEHVFGFISPEEYYKNDNQNMLCVTEDLFIYLADSIGNRLPDTPDKLFANWLAHTESGFVETDFVDMAKMLDAADISSKGMMGIKLGDGPEVLEKLKAEAEKLEEPLSEIDGSEAVFKIRLGDEECGVKLMFDKSTDKEDAKLLTLGVVIIETGNVEDLEALIKERVEKVAIFKEKKENETFSVYEVNNDNDLHYLFGPNGEVYILIISSEDNK